MRERAAQFKSPVLFLQAGDDRIADGTLSGPLCEAIGSEDKRYVEYPGMRHEILNENGKERVLAEIKTWMETRLN